VRVKRVPRAGRDEMRREREESRRRGRSTRADSAESCVLLLMKQLGCDPAHFC